MRFFKRSRLYASVHKRQDYRPAVHQLARSLRSTLANPTAEPIFELEGDIQVASQA